MKRVMVSGASGLVGYSCLKALKSVQRYYLVGTSIYDSDVAKKYCDIFLIAPHTESNHYLDWLEKTVKNYAIDLLIPGIEIDLYKWNEIRNRIDEWGIKVILNSSKLIELCRDKWVFYEKIKKINEDIWIPTIFQCNYDVAKKALGSEMIVKPRRGYGSIGIHYISDEREYNFYKKDDSIIQKRIFGEEYTVGVFYDKDSNLCTYIPFQRKLGRGGFTEFAETKDHPQIEPVISELGKELGAVGITNYQFINDGGHLKLLEINPRISSSTSIRALLGYNECDMGVKFTLWNELPYNINIKKGKVTRFIEEIAVYDGNHI